MYRWMEGIKIRKYTLKKLINVTKDVKRNKNIYKITCKKNKI